MRVFILSFLTKMSVTTSRKAGMSLCVAGRILILSDILEGELVDHTAGRYKMGEFKPVNQRLSQTVGDTWLKIEHYELLSRAHF